MNTENTCLNDIETRVENLLYIIGANPKKPVFFYMKECVIIAFSEKQPLKISELYSKVAIKFNRTIYAIDYGMKKAINQIFISHGFDNLNRLLQIELFDTRQKPKNWEFVATFCEILKIQRFNGLF